MTITSISVYRFPTLASQIWAFSQMIFARPALAATPDLGFYKLMGSGTKDGFCPNPNFSVYGILSVWPNLEVAQEQVEHGKVFQRYRDHSSEAWSVFLAPTQARGRWSGKAPFEVGSEPVHSPYGTTVAALTRATLEPRHARTFWQQVPGISVDIAKQTEMAFMIGLGEVPWLHQATFTIWRDVAPMEEFAFNTFHGTAVRRVREEGWFKEELFARFAVMGTVGTWNGSDPLGDLRHEPTPIAAVRSDHPAIA